eukprot:TRINITY_DN97116_c0_g1_i1.p1 TRINITY_DN97116_c0_g1~~TRINITY_DN97116_c0_g1_i1.p1  ORF type:complete len:304 (+),score=54.33 TRINITY_DN97116_c0_g1_i1:131-1042(+)
MTDSASRSLPVGRRVLVFGWGAACEEVLRELATYAGAEAGGSSSSCNASAVKCISHTKQASDCDLQEVSKSLGFECVLLDKNAEILEETRKFRPDLILSASYRKRIPNSVLQLGQDCINFHPSLLPKHRGCWSGFWTIFEGDAETGVTCHRMVEEFDAGLLLHQERIAVASDDTSISIYRKLLPVTAACARQVFSLYFRPSGMPDGDEQKGEGSYNFRALPFDGLIQPEWDDRQVERFIRAMHYPPFDGAAMLIGDKRILVDNLEAYHCLKQGTAVAAASAMVAASAASASAAVVSGTSPLSA